VFAAVNFFKKKKKREEELARKKSPFFVKGNFLIF